MLLFDAAPNNLCFDWHLGDAAAVDGPRLDGPKDAGAQLLTVRRIAIFAIMLLAYIYYRSAGDAQLAAIGLLSFAAVAQFAPAMLKTRPNILPPAHSSRPFPRKRPRPPRR